MLRSQDKPPSGTNFEAFCKRLDWLKKKTGVEISSEEKKWGSDLKNVIENPIGFVKMPLAIAGPIHVKGSYAAGEYLIPLCTVEGTLSMSLTRGAYFTGIAGGVTTKHLGQSMSRSPVFFLNSIEEVNHFEKWIETHYSEIKAVAESTTRYGKLQKIEPHFIGSKVILDFIYTTADASGQNMTTFATWEACLWIQKKYPSNKPVQFFVESNYNGDKNVSHRTLIKGRGHSVTAETTIPKKFIERLLGQQGVKNLMRGSIFGSAATQLSGIPTYNLHTVNALAAIYLACGQDVACVVENAMNTLLTEQTDDGDFKVSLHMPSITVGTVGAATLLEDQQKNLQIMGCTGENSAKKFAEVIAAACLAIEMSLGVAITNQEFAQAHLKYSRGK